MTPKKSPADVRREAEAQFHIRREQRAQEQADGRTNAYAEARRIAKNTTRLRALRLAKEATDKAAAAEKKPAATRQRNGDGPGVRLRKGRLKHGR